MKIKMTPTSDSTGHEPATHVIRPVLEIAALHQPVENAVLDAGEILVKLILQCRQFDVRLRAVRKNSGKQCQLVRFEPGPLRKLLFQVEHILFVRVEPQHVVFLFFLDHKVTAHGEVHDGGRDVAHGRIVVHQRARFGRGHPFGRSVLHGDRAHARIAPSRVPQPEHEQEDEHGEKDGPVALQELIDQRARSGLCHEALVPAHHDGQPFVKRQAAAAS